MNCKPGDLAMYVGMHDELRGQIVCVIKPAAPDADKLAVAGPWWTVEPPLNGYTRCADASLRPIRDPGPDAVDETLQWIGSPTKEAA